MDWGFDGCGGHSVDEALKFGDGCQKSGEKDYSGNSEYFISFHMLFF